MVTSEELLQLFGANLRRLRKEARLSLRELEAESGIENADLSRIEHGKINISLETMAKIMSGLNCKPDQLFKDEEMK